MRDSHKLSIRIPASAVDELDEVEQMDWSLGIPLEDLLQWLNHIAARFRPDDIDEKARTSQEFTARAFRHYQTLGCIDPPSRHGKRVHYGFRHYLQGLLLRRLLWERVSSEHIVRIMAGRSNADYKRLLFEGIEIVPRRGAGARANDRPGRDNPQLWSRLELYPGVEIHLSKDRPPIPDDAVEHILAKIQAAITRPV